MSQLNGEQGFRPLSQGSSLFNNRSLLSEALSMI
jgi:hypothetical protein